MRGDCSIRLGNAAFGDEEIAACAERRGLLSLELEWPSRGRCRCPACTTASSGPQTVLSPAEVHTLIDQAAVLGCRRWIFVEDPDGSACACSDLKPIIATTTRPGMQAEWLTDGACMTAELAQLLHDHRVVVSLPFEALPHATPLQQAGYGHANAPSIAIRLTIPTDGSAQLLEHWRQVRASGMEPRLQIYSPQEQSEPPAARMPPERIADLLARIDSEEFGRPWSRPAAIAARSCNRHLYSCHVAACGTVYACAGVTIPLGSVRHEPLRDILGLSEVLENLRDYKSKVKEPCQSCCQSTDCHGCRGAAYQATGDYLAGDALCPKALNVLIPALPVEAGGMVPHGPSMRMSGQIVEIGERRAVTEYKIPANSPMVDRRGRLDECSCIELIAQTFAACHGFHMSVGEAHRIKGLLLGIRNLAITGTAHVGDTLRIEVRKQVRFGDFSVIEGVIHHADGRILGRGEIKLWRPDNADALPTPALSSRASHAI